MTSFTNDSVINVEAYTFYKVPIIFQLPLDFLSYPSLFINTKRSARRNKLRHNGRGDFYVCTQLRRLKRLGCLARISIIVITFPGSGNNNCRLLHTSNEWTVFFCMCGPRNNNLFPCKHGNLLRYF